MFCISNQTAILMFCADFRGFIFCGALDFKILSRITIYSNKQSAFVDFQAQLSRSIHYYYFKY